MQVPDSGFKAVVASLTGKTAQTKPSFEFAGYRVKNAFTGEFKAMFKVGDQEHTLDQHQCEQVAKGNRPDSDKYKAVTMALKHWPGATI